MKKISLIILSLFAALNVGAITLDSCRALARNNYPLIQQYSLITRTEEYSVENAMRAWIPKVLVSAQATYQSDAANINDIINDMLPESILPYIKDLMPDLYMRKFQGKVQLDIQQNIWDGGQAAANKRLARAEARANEASLDVELYQLESRVDNLFFGVLLLDEQLAQTESLHNLLAENLRNARVLLNNNMVLQSDVNAIEAEYLTCGQKLEQIRYAGSAYRKMLSIMTGQDMKGLELEKPAELPLRIMKERERPELKLLDQKSNLINEQIRNVRTFSMPQFSAFASGWYGYPSLDMFKSMQSSEWGLNGIVGVKMSWNITPYYTQSNRIRMLQLNQQQIELQRGVFLFNQNLQQTQEESEILRLRKAMQDDERIVQLRQSVREAAESQYRNGTITTNELLQHLMDENNARRAKSIHEIELLKTQYELEHTL